MALSQFGLGVAGVSLPYESEPVVKEEKNNDQYLVYPPDDGTDKKINPYGQH